MGFVNPRLFFDWAAEDHQNYSLSGRQDLRLDLTVQPMHYCGDHSIGLALRSAKRLYLSVVLLAERGAPAALLLAAKRKAPFAIS